MFQRALSGGGGINIPHVKTGTFTYGTSGATITDIGFIPRLFIAFAKDYEYAPNQGAPYFLVYAQNIGNDSKTYQYLYYNTTNSRWQWYYDLPVTNNTVGQFILGTVGGNKSIEMTYIAYE